MDFPRILGIPRKNKVSEIVTGKFEKWELDIGSFFCSGLTPNLLDSSAAAPGKHFAWLPRGDSWHVFSLQFLRILRISLEIMFLHYQMFPSTTK